MVTGWPMKPISHVVVNSFNAQLFQQFYSACINLYRIYKLIIEPIIAIMFLNKGKAEYIITDKKKSIFLYKQFIIAANPPDLSFPLIWNSSICLTWLIISFVK